MNGLGGAGLVDIKGTGGRTGFNHEASQGLPVIQSAVTRADVDRGAPLEGVHSCYSKMALRQANQNNRARTACVARCL